MKRRLRLVRFTTAYIPLAILQRLTKFSIKTAKLPQNMTKTAVIADGVKCDWLVPKDQSSNHVLLYFHGGGFVFGQTGLHLELGAYLSDKMKTRVLMVDYRLAPKHPFPAALDDCVTVYRWLLKEGIPANKICVAGDSAGGNLTITTLMKLRDEGDPLPVAGACMSPVADLTERESDIKDLVLHKRAVRKFRQSYIAHTNVNDPYMSPIFGNWNDLPPLLIHAGEEEVLKEDTLRITEVAKETNTKVTVKIYPRMFHVWQIYPDLPETKDSLDHIAEFLKSHLNNKGNS